MTQPAKSKAPVLVTVLVTLVGLGMITVLCGGIFAAIAIPAFIGQIRRSKTAEAVSNIGALTSGIAAYAMTETADPGTGRFGSRGLPPSLPLTPPTQGASRRAWPIDADPLWGELGLATFDSLYYSYEVVSNRTTGEVTVRAVGDLDGDGTTSEFARHGRLDPTGEIVWDAGLTITNELE